LGDSFVDPFELDDSETIAVKLQENLNEDYEVIPLGSRGYSTTQEFLLLEEEGLAYDPDIVILFFFQNDFEDNRMEVMGYGDRPAYRNNGTDFIFSNLPTQNIWNKRLGPNRRSLSEKEPFSSFMLKHSHLYSLWYHSKPKMFDKLFDEKINYFDEYQDRLNIYNEKNYSNETSFRVLTVLALFDKIEMMSRENNFEFVVVNIPDKRNVNKEVQRRLLSQWGDVNESYFEFKQVENIFRNTIPTENINSNYKIEYISLFDLAENNFENFYFKTDDHWSPSGVKLSADYITEELRERKII